MSEMCCSRPSAPERHSDLFWLVSDSWIMAKRSIMHIIRSMDQVLSLILFPIMFMLLNRYVLGAQSTRATSAMRTICLRAS